MKQNVRVVSHIEVPSAKPLARRLQPMRHYGWILFGVMIALALVTLTWAQDDEAVELAKKLANPIASLISVQLQYNYDEYGDMNDNASVSRLNI